MAKKKKKRRAAKPSLLVSGAIGFNILGQWNRNDGAPDLIVRAERTGRDFISSYIGIDPVTGTTDIHYLKRGLLPLIIAIAMKKLLGRRVSPYLKGLPFSF